MKKLPLLFVLLSTSSLVSFGQKIGVKAGITFPTIATKSDYILEDAPNALDYQLGTSYFAGATVDFDISKTFAIQTGLSFIGKGGNDKFNSGSTVFTTKTKLYYLELPINAIYKIPVKIGNIFLGGGPYYAYGIEGKYKYSSNQQQNNADSQSAKISFGKNKDFKAGDFGLNFLAGFELNNRINIQAGYGLGLRSITSDGITYYSEKNSVISLGLGYSFK